jgi:ATP-dependent RNA helicase RhlE
VAPDEEADLRAIERAIGRTLPRITLPDFDYKAKPHVKLEIPLAQRIAAIRARKSDERARAKANAERRGAAQKPDHKRPPGTRPSSSRPHRRRRPRHRS